MNVKDVMNSDVVSCKPDDEISSAARLLKEHDISGLPVIEEGKVVGIVTEADVLKLLEVPEHGGLWLPSPFEVIEIPIRELINWEETKHMLTNIGTKPIRDIMESEVYTISADSSIEDASSIMVKHKVNRLPVLDGEAIVGIITRGDIIRGLAEV